jgi:hypothetical protein
LILAGRAAVHPIAPAKAAAWLYASCAPMAAGQLVSEPRHQPDGRAVLPECAPEPMVTANVRNRAQRERDSNSLQSRERQPIADPQPNLDKWYNRHHILGAPSKCAILGDGALFHKAIAGDCLMPSSKFQRKKDQRKDAPIPIVTDFLSLTGMGELIVNAKIRGLVWFKAIGLEGVPGCMEVSGARELLPIGTARETVKLAIAGLTVKAEVLGWRKDTGVLLLKTRSLFREIAKALKEI